MNEFITSFSLGIFCLSLLFLLSCLIVITAKSVYFSILQTRKNQPQPAVEEQPPIKKPPAKKPPAPRKPRAPQKPSVIRTIEIDPNQVDRIYVKKAQ